MIKSSCDVLISNFTVQRYDKMCKNCKELASLTSRNKESFMETMKNIDMLKEKYRTLKYDAPNQCDEVIRTCDEGTMVQGENVLTPINVKTSGRPSSLRMVSVIEKVTKKVQGKKSHGRNKQQSNNATKKKGGKKKACNLISFTRT
jgi:hypothetical protein